MSPKMKKADTKTMTEEKNPIVKKSRISVLPEILIAFCLCTVVSLIGPLFAFFDPLSLPYGTYLDVAYSENMFFSIDKGILLSSLVIPCISIPLLLLLFAFLRPSGLKPMLGRKGKNLIPLCILSLFGLLAYIVIAALLSSFVKGNIYLPLLVSGILTGIYEYLIYKLYLEGRSQSNALFWEIFRFAIVGLVAAVFDFLTCYLVQFVLFRNSKDVYVTVVATACGFLIGVLINYLMSTYMVYKASRSGFSKTAKGIVFFVFLSALGLGIGMGIQAFLYDYLFLKKSILLFSYPVDFVIRTLIVMIYNYVSRKLLIYRK